MKPVRRRRLDATAECDGACSGLLACEGWCIWKRGEDAPPESCASVRAVTTDGCALVCRAPRMTRLELQRGESPSAKSRDNIQGHGTPTKLGSGRGMTEMTRRHPTGISALLAASITLTACGP